ncbi:MAG TPA: hypothetical protein PKL17_19835 [Pseudomonadota bacterium]|nr:hypothetical protein [Pseudomonadota bacterium]HNI60374.1 hypothetical protein [Pseudomonadota bacterium]HNK47044.1 hypothetical protein [Pseudomonadota bacterium]
MAASYFPRSDSGLVVWLQNFQSALPLQAKALGLAPAEIKDALDQSKSLAASIQVDEQKYAEWQAAVAKTAELRTQALAEIQRIIDRMKTSTGYSDEIGKTLMAVPSRTESRNLDDIKPALRAQVHGGKVRIHWTRGALDGINVYSRKPGEPWTLLGTDTRPPYDDTRPVPASPEVREYRAIGVFHDQEVGHPSDVVSVTVSA